MEAGKNVDAWGTLHGHVLEQADAEAAYLQADYVGTETWVMLPPDAWPAEWMDKDGHCIYGEHPVVQMKKALYGHPDSGTMWEKHCNKELEKAGFVPVPNWPSVFRHPRLQLMLSVYVDDFSMSGPKGNMKEGWRLIKESIDIGEPEVVDRGLARALVPGAGAHPALQERLPSATAG